MRDPQLPPTNDPAELARRTQELLIAERLLDGVLASAPAMWDTRFKNLDAQLDHQGWVSETDQLTKAVTRNPDDLWTAEPNDRLNAITPSGGFWCIFPPKNDPDIKHPRANYIFQRHPDGRRVINIGPFPPGEEHMVQDIVDEGNEGR